MTSPIITNIKDMQVLAPDKEPEEFPEVRRASQFVRLKGTVTRQDILPALQQDTTTLKHLLTPLLQWEYSQLVLELPSREHKHWRHKQAADESLTAAGK